MSELDETEEAWGHGLAHFLAFEAVMDPPRQEPPSTSGHPGGDEPTSGLSADTDERELGMRVAHRIINMLPREQGIAPPFPTT